MAIPDPLTWSTDARAGASLLAGQLVAAIKTAVAKDESPFLQDARPVYDDQGDYAYAIDVVEMRSGWYRLHVEPLGPGQEVGLADESAVTAAIRSILKAGRA